MSNDYRIGIIGAVDFRSSLNGALIQALREEPTLILSEANYFRDDDPLIITRDIVFPEPKINCKKGHTYLPPEYKCRCGKELGYSKENK